MKFNTQKFPLYGMGRRWHPEAVKMIHTELFCLIKDYLLLFQIWHATIFLSVYSKRALLLVRCVARWCWTVFYYLFLFKFSQVATAWLMNDNTLYWTKVQNHESMKYCISFWLKICVNQYYLIIVIIETKVKTEMVCKVLYLFPC